MTGFRFDDPDQYVHGTPFAEFARLRREAPFAWHASSQIRSDGFWLVAQPSWTGRMIVIQPSMRRTCTATRLERAGDLLQLNPR